MENLNREKRSRIYKKVTDDLEKRIESGWYGEITLTVRKGIVELAVFKDSKKYV